jgi:dihydrofolate reductase
MFNIIIAADENYGIGKNNNLPWNCKSDLLHFKETTVNHILIVGRKTWDTMPKQKILQNRKVIVVSNTLCSNNQILVSNCLTTALDTANNIKLKDQQVFVIGGVQLYKEAIVHKDLNLLYLTHIYGVHDCDTFAIFIKQELHKFIELSSSTKTDCKIVCYSKQPFS